MPKNLPVGHTDCHVCGFAHAEVKTDKSEKAYVYCPDCNIQSFTRNEYQSNKLKEKMRPVTVTVEPAQKVEQIKTILPAQKPAAPSGFNMGL